MVTRVVITFAIVFFFYSAAYPLSIDSQDMQSLQGGNVVLKPVKQNSVKGTETAIIINAPHEKVWQVLEQKENLSTFIEQVEEARVLSNNGSDQMVKTSVKICKLLPSFDYVICFDHSEKYRRMTFRKTSGCFKELFGSFEFIPYGDSTILDCQVYADPGFYIPVFVGNNLKSDVENIMRSIKREAER